MAVTINASTTAGLVQTADTSGVLALQTAGTTAVTIDASQNVGIGTSSPQSLLDVTGNDPTIRLTDNGGSPIATFSMRSADATYRIRDVTNSTDRLTINANGAVALSAASVSATGVGITFPATQSASSDVNTLDDYEEGTWTPTVTFGGGSATVSGFAAYIKIGKTCLVNGYISFSSVSSASAGAITNFPFTAANISGSPRQVFVAREDAATGKMGQLYISAGSTTAALQDYAGANAGTVFANGYTWIFTGTYNTSA